jgi:uncharacterized protein YciI
MKTSGRSSPNRGENAPQVAIGESHDYWENVALIVLEAAWEAEANEIAKNDPAVNAYVFHAQVRPFDVHFITNKYQTER